MFGNLWEKSARASGSNKRSSPASSNKLSKKYIKVSVTSSPTSLTSSQKKETAKKDKSSQYSKTPSRACELGPDTKVVGERSEKARHPFQADPSDHAETSKESYDDILPLLDALAKDLGKKRDTLSIYDPYYCDGGVKKRLVSLGFKKCYNRNEDFYEKIETGTTPDYDVLLTNPPYSGNHPEKMLRFCAATGKPWLALVPNWVYAKEYFRAIFGDEDSINGNSSAPFFLVPKQRYSYYVPGWQKTTSGELGGTTSPFMSLWICGMKYEALMQTNKFLRALPLGDIKGGMCMDGSPAAASCRFQLGRSVAELPYRAREGTADPARSSKRPNPKQRKKLAAAKARKAAA